MVSGQAIVHDRAATEKAAAAPMTEAEFEAFYRRTSRPLWAYVVRITGDPATADDVVQKAFYHFLRAKRNTTNEAQLRAYVFKIATNLTFDHFRQKKRESGERIEDERGS
ncbi:MAG TPA: RNA polymerase sigma factor, partial [Thermoanaerobaculia bacterium]